MSDHMPDVVLDRIRANRAARGGGPYYVVQADGCWLWVRSVNPSNGYGKVEWQQHDRRHGTTAHRVVYTAFVGPIPEAHDVDHLCRNRACVNPAHLDVVTRSENVRRGSKTKASGYFVPPPTKTHCKNGHEFTPENTYIGLGPHGPRRKCRACRRK